MAFAPDPFALRADRVFGRGRQNGPTKSLVWHTTLKSGNTKPMVRNRGSLLGLGIIQSLEDAIDCLAPGLLQPLE
jgi:hypothetical protein